MQRFKAAMPAHPLKPPLPLPLLQRSALPLQHLTVEPLQMEHALSQFVRETDHFHASAHIGLPH